MAPADLRLIASSALQIDESMLTGEAAPAAKVADQQVQGDAALGDRVNMTFAGTMVVAGQGRGLVVGTGTSTELGGIARLARAAREPRTPLQQALKQLSAEPISIAAAGVHDTSRTDPTAASRTYSTLSKCSYESLPIERPALLLPLVPAEKCSDGGDFRKSKLRR